MKILPCSKCGEARLKEGIYYCCSWPGHQTFQYKCRCGKTNTISKEMWAQIPNISPEEMVEKGIANWQHTSLPREQQEELRKKGFTLPDVIELSRDMQELLR